MSSGPIKSHRDAWKPPKVSTTDADRICGPSDRPNRGYCGREAKGAKRTQNWDAVVCADCHAARRADQQAGVAA